MSDVNITIRLNMREADVLRQVIAVYVVNNGRVAARAASEGRPELERKVEVVEQIFEKLQQALPTETEMLTLTGSDGRVLMTSFFQVGSGFYRYIDGVDADSEFGHREDILRRASLVLMDNPGVKPSGVLADEYTAYARDIMGLKP